MANDSSLPVRRGLLTKAKANDALTALVSAGSIYPQSPPGAPAWPFIRYGGPTTIPIRAACVDGCEVSVALHAFAKPRKSGQVVVETAEDHAARIAAALVMALAGRITLSEGRTAKVRWTGSQLLQDGDEADAYHAIANFRVRVLS